MLPASRSAEGQPLLDAQITPTGCSPPRDRCAVMVLRGLAERPAVWDDTRSPFLPPMSRAFVKEDGPEPRPIVRHVLPPRDDPSFPEAAARALLEGARVSEVLMAEEATGHTWGDPALRPHVERVLAEARAASDDRLEQVAERYLREANRGNAR